MSKKGSFEGANESIDELLNLDLEGKSEDELAEIQNKVTNAFQNASQEQMQALAMVSRKINLALSEIASKRNAEISDETAREEGAEALPDHEQTPEEALEVPPSDPEIVEANLNPVDQKGPEEEIITTEPSEAIAVEEEGVTKPNHEQTPDEAQIDGADKEPINFIAEVKSPKSLNIDSSKDYSDELIGKRANWKSGDKLQYKESREIESITEFEGKKYVHFKNGIDAIPLDEIVPDQMPDLDTGISEKELKKVGQEIEVMAVEEKEAIGKGLDQIGFYADERKNAFFAWTFDKAAQLAKSKNVFNRWAWGRSTATKFAEAMRDTYIRDQEGSRQKALKMRAGGLKTGLSTAYLLGNAAKIGRNVGDAIGWSTFAPLRGVTLAAQIFGRVSEAGKEVRLKNEEVISKNRWGGGKEGEALQKDIELAQEEAKRIYEAAEKKGGGKVSAKELNQAYFENLPKDLLDRVSRTPDTALNFVERAVKWQIDYSIKALNHDIRTIQDNPKYDVSEKEGRIRNLLLTEEKRLRDYDRIVSQYGTADVIATGARYSHLLGKHVASAMAVETLAVSGYHLAENLLNIFNHSESATETAAAIVASHDSASKDSAAKIIADKLGLHPDTSAHLDTTHTSIPHLDSMDTHPDSATSSFDSTHVQASDTSTSLHSTAPNAENLSPQEQSAEAYAIHQQGTLERMGEHNSEVVGTIHKGETVTSKIDQMVKEGLISKEDASLARNNPLSGGWKGDQYINIDKGWLVHEGNELHFIPGEDGEAPRIDIVTAEGHQFGSDQDLYDYYIKKGIKPPEILKKSVEKIWDMPHMQGGDIEASLPDNTTPEIISDQEVPIPLAKDSVADSLDKTKLVDTAHAVDSTKTTLDSAHKTVGTIESDKNTTDWEKIATYGAIGAGLAAAGVGGYAAKKIMEHRKEEGGDVEITDVFKKVKETKASRNQSENLQTEPLPVSSSEKVLSDKEIKKLSHDEKVKKILERLSFEKSGFTKADLSILMQNINKRAYVEVYKKLLLKWNESKGNKSARDAILAVNKIISHLPQGDSHAKRFEKRIMDEKQTSTQDQ